MAATSNGHSRRWTVTKDKRFEVDAARLVAQYPRLESVFAAIEDQFGAIPTYRAIDVGQDRWLYVTHAALGAPPVVLFYEIQPLQHIVLLIGADLNQ